MREAWRTQDALGLKKMTAFMADNDLESGTDGEANSRDKRIPKANAVDVFSARADDEFPAGFVSGEKAFENGSANVRCGPDLRWSRSSLGDWRRLDKAANKPAPEPSGSNLLDRRIRILVDRHGNRRQIGFVRDANMLETLAHTPRAGRQLPIELFLGEFSDELSGGQVVGVQVRSKADGPSGRAAFLWYGHNADHNLRCRSIADEGSNRFGLGTQQYAERQAMGYEKQRHVGSQDEIASA
jgi:hypothetical protein